MPRAQNVMETLREPHAGIGRARTSWNAGPRCLYCLTLLSALPENRELQEQPTKQRPSPWTIFLILIKKQNSTTRSLPLQASQPHHRLRAQTKARGLGLEARCSDNTTAMNTSKHSLFSWSNFFAAQAYTNKCGIHIRVFKANWELAAEKGVLKADQDPIPEHKQSPKSLCAESASYLPISVLPSFPW